MALFLFAGTRPGQALPDAAPVPAAPPPAPPAVRRAVSPAAPVQARAPKDNLTLYSIGEPTDEEQLCLEFINRSRADPPAEGLRLRDTTDPDVRNAYSYFQVDTNLMVEQFDAIAAAPPLSFNSSMIAAARGHSGWMYSNSVQCHWEDIPFTCPRDGTNGPGERLDAAGYNWNVWGENVFAFAKSVWHGHAAFNVDWGQQPGGMQDPPGHRQNIHDPDFREVGIGIFNGSYGTNGSVGPRLVTEDFGDRYNSPALVTGVAYYDLNGNGFYDMGEGLSEITVNVSDSAFYARTAGSGGYSVPAPSGERTVTFSGLGLEATEQWVFIDGDQNVKADLVLDYHAPVIAGPAEPSLNQNNSYSFTAVAGATAYQWWSAFRTLFTATEGAEGGLGHVTVDASPGYAVIDTSVKLSGTASFHLAHPAERDQFLTLNGLFRVLANAQLCFASQLGWAMPGQVARAQVSTNNGASWLDLWSQPGSGGAGETNFTRRTNSLAAFVGQEFQVRFVYDYTGGSYFPQTDSDVGLHLDDISFANVEEVVGLTTNDVPSGTNFVFAPTVGGSYSLRVRPRVSGRYLDFGPELQVTAGEPWALVLSPVFNLVSLPFEDTGLTDAEQLAQAISNCTVVCKWDAATQSWRSHPTGGPNNFDLAVGEVCFVAVTARATFQPAGTWAAITNALKRGYNFITLPKAREALATAAQLVGSIPNCAAAWKWDAPTQSWLAHRKGGSSGFAVEVGKPYLINVSADGTW